jgi:predicted PurR-regulated permease PerM
MADSERDEPAAGSTNLFDLTAQPSTVRLVLFSMLALAVLYTLYAARSLFVPMVLALMFSLLLSPLVSELKRIHIPRPISSALLICMLCVPFVALVIQLAEPAQKWLGKLPELSVQVTEQLADLDGSATVDATPPPVVAVVPEQKKRFDFFGLFADDAPEPAPAAAQAIPPEPVEDSALMEGVKQGGVEALLSLVSATPFIITQFGIWLILVLFLLIFGPGLYDNVINLMPMIRDKRRAALLVGRLRQELSRYILTVTLINAGFGAVVGFALWWLGVEDAVLWGALVALLNYAPYVGPAIVIGILCIAGTVQYGFEWHALMPPAVYLGINLVESQYLTPTLLGQNMRLNPLILIVWLVIWGWLWGTVGALLAVPLLVCMKLVASQLDVLPRLVELTESQD